LKLLNCRDNPCGVCRSREGLAHRRVLDLAALQPSQRRHRHPHRLGELVLTQAGPPAQASGPRRTAHRQRHQRHAIDDAGCLPWSITAIENYARARDIPTVKLRAVDRYVAEVTALRAAAGKWTPPRPPTRGERPDETVIAGVAEAYRQARTRPLTQKLHRRLGAESRGEIPGPAVVDRAAKRHGTTAAAIRERARTLARDQTGAVIVVRVGASQVSHSGVMEAARTLPRTERGAAASASRRRIPIRTDRLR
jgi:hypothetical protein